jgi:hypothetical protein
MRHEIGNMQYLSAESMLIMHSCYLHAAIVHTDFKCGVNLNTSTCILVLAYLHTFVHM